MHHGGALTVDDVDQRVAKAMTEAREEAMKEAREEARRETEDLRSTLIAVVEHVEGLAEKLERQLAVTETERV